MTTQELTEKYIPLANKLAYQKKKTLPRFVDVEDLKSAAYLGLVQAASRFDPKKGVAFSTFAYSRIFGAIHDYLREQKYEMQTMRLDLSNNMDCTLGDTLEARVEGNSDEFLEMISLCDEQAKEVLCYYFVDEYSMKEIGEKFGVSESRISQLIKQYKNRIKETWNREEFCSVLAA